MRVIILWFGLLCCNAYSQTPNRMRISYNESVQLHGVQETTYFTISGNGLSVQLQGNKINEFIFSTPGDYTIAVVEKEHFTKGDCNHSVLPKSIAVQVSNVKMNFDGTHLTMSAPIQKNKETTGTVLSIPVQIQTFDGKPIVMSNKTVKVVGIGSSLTAKLDDTLTELPQGQHVLTYTLEGKVTENAYLMFDFVKSDGTIQSVSMNHPIQTP